MIPRSQYAKFIAMSARGMTIREIQGYLAEMYSTEVSPEFISKLTDEMVPAFSPSACSPYAMAPRVRQLFIIRINSRVRTDAIKGASVGDTRQTELNLLQIKGFQVATVRSRVAS